MSDEALRSAHSGVIQRIECCFLAHAFPPDTLGPHVLICRETFGNVVQSVSHTLHGCVRRNFTVRMGMKPKPLIECMMILWIWGKAKTMSTLFCSCRTFFDSGTQGSQYSQNFYQNGVFICHGTNSPKIWMPRKTARQNPTVFLIRATKYPQSLPCIAEGPKGRRGGQGFLPVPSWPQPHPNLQPNPGRSCGAMKDNKSRSHTSHICDLSVGQTCPWVFYMA